MLYDITQSFEYNVTYGPFWDEEIPQIPTSKNKTHFLGFELNSPFGVSACPMTHGSRNVSLMSKLGYDLITYRSVRSVEWHGQKALPHWRYVDINKQLNVEDLSESILGSEEPFPGQEVSTVNSFGIQSLKPEYWQADFNRANQSLHEGQLLILSIMFTPEDGKDVVDDAKVVAKYANETSAKVFEINLAHPNSGMKSLVYEDIETSVAICKSVRESIGDKPLIAKIGYYRQPEMLKEFLQKTQGLIQGISSTNTYAMTIVDAQGTEVFPGRPKAGVSGAAIRTLSMEQAKSIVTFKNELGLKELVVIGIGGVTKSEHIDQYLALGVDAVQSAAGVFADPLLAYKYKSKEM